MVDIQGILSYAKLGLEKFREILMFIAGIIAKYVGLPQENIYAFLIILISIWIAAKVFYWRSVTMKGRYTEFLIIAVIVYFVLKMI